MEPARAYYSVIQYCPDLSRMEGANIGVLLFCHAREFCGVRMAANTRRIEQFFGPKPDDKWPQIRSSIRAIAERIELESEDWLNSHWDVGRYRVSRFINQRANQIQMTPLRPMRVTKECEAELGVLFADLVETK